MYLGIALTRLEDHDNAAAAHNKAISMEPEEPLFRLNFGVLLEVPSLVPCRHERDTHTSTIVPCSCPWTSCRVQRVSSCDTNSGVMEHVGPLTRV